MDKHHNELGSEKISKLIWKQSVPAMIGLFVLALYNVVDTIFLGHYVGTLAVAALAVSVPVHILVIALAQTIGIGASSITSRRLGAKDYETAGKALGTSFVLMAVIGVVAPAFGIFYLDEVLTLFGATDAIMPYAREYLSVLLFGAIFLLFVASSNNIIRSEGKAKFAMSVMLSSAVVNIILDPIFIVWLEMGVRGAAIATVISQIVAFVLVVYYFAAGKSGIRWKWNYLCLELKIVKEMFAIGISSFARQASGSFVAIVFNNLLAFYGGEVGIAAYGIVMRITMLFIMPMFGVLQGMLPVLGYNYGAKAYKRAHEVVSKSIKYSTYIATGAFVLLLVFAGYAVRAFTSDSELITVATRALRLAVLVLPLIGFQLVAAGVYQAVGKAKPAFLLSMLRQALLLIPAVIILSEIYGLDGIWLSFPVSDFVAGIITFFMLRRELRLIDRKV